MAMCLAVPGEVMSMADNHGMRFAKVRFGGITRDVCLEYQPEARIGDFVLVHVGFAIATINREEAAQMLAVLEEIGHTDDPAADGGDLAS